MTKSTQRAKEQSDFVIPSEPKILRLVFQASSGIHMDKNKGFLPVLYSKVFVCMYNLSIKELQNFRQTGFRKQLLF